MSDPVILYITVSSRAEGLHVGRALVDAQLAACANVFDHVTSIFRWDDAVQEEGEALLIAKSRTDLVVAATDLVKREHSYDCPCVVAIPIQGGNPEFLNWIVSETGPKTST